MQSLTIPLSILDRIVAVHSAAADRVRMHHTAANIRVRKHRKRVCLEITEAGSLVFQRYMTTTDAEELAKTLSEYVAEEVIGNQGLPTAKEIDLEK